MPNGVPIDVGITSPVHGGDNFTATITLDSVATSNTSVSLSRDNTTVVTGPMVQSDPDQPPTRHAFPGAAVVLAGQSSVTVTLGTTAVSTSTTVHVTAIANGGSATGSVTVNP